MRDSNWLPERLSDLIREQKQEDRTILVEEIARIYERGWDKGFDKGFNQRITTQKEAMKRKQMELGDIVNIRAPYSGYWEGKIVEISYGWKHTLNDEGEPTITYMEPTVEVYGIDNPGHAFVSSANLKRRDNGWFEKERGEE
jgi:hypothetical protein